MKCPQLSKPEEPKLHRWQNGEKTLWETRLSRGGGSSPLASRTSSLFQLLQSQIVSGPLIPVFFSSDRPILFFITDTDYLHVYVLDNQYAEPIFIHCYKVNK